jgi:hypothetical protein
MKQEKRYHKKYDGPIDSAPSNVEYLISNARKVLA